MLRQTTQHFIADRALALAYEARQFPQTSPVALAWLNRARAWAEQRSMKALTTTLLATMQRIEDSMADIERPCPYCGREMEEGIIGATCASGSHNEICGWLCERCDYSQAENGHVYP